MTSTTTLMERNRTFADEFTASDLPILPKMRSVIVTCADARVDPAHVLGLELGDSVVIRNNGGRVTPEVIEEIGALAFMVAMMEGGTQGRFEVILVQHTQCGAERFANPEFQKALKGKTGIDVSAVAIHDHGDSLRSDVKRLRDAPEVPGHIIVSAMLYDVQDGRMREVIAPIALSDI